MRPNFVNVYQYCNSHQAGETRSVTDSPFRGGLRKRSRGERLSKTTSFPLLGLEFLFTSASSLDRFRSLRRSCSRPSGEFGCSPNRFRCHPSASLPAQRKQRAPKKLTNPVTKALFDIIILATGAPLLTLTQPRDNMFLVFDICHAQRDSHLNRL